MKGGQPRKAASGSCNILINGGSTAALAATLSSVRSLDEQSSDHVCLIEPTDWIGGQITSGGVPAIDTAWHTIKTEDGKLPVKDIARAPQNLPPELDQWLRQVKNPGDCWVSLNCFKPDLFLNHFDPILEKFVEQGRLSVYRDSVLKKVEFNEEKTRIVAVEIVKRKVRDGQHAYGRHLSEALPDWYSKHDSQVFSKEVIRLSPKGKEEMIVIEASEFGDILGFLDFGVGYTQGVHEGEQSFKSLDPICGQSFVFPFVIKGRRGQGTVRSLTQDQDSEGDESFSLGKFSWEEVWTYRRLLKSDAYDLSMQNWDGGNDYQKSYLLLHPEEASKEVGDWQGGVNLTSLKQAEKRALDYFQWYRAKAPSVEFTALTMDTETFGTAHGLSKIPYIRDSRRSIGRDIGGEPYLLTFDHMGYSQGRRLGTEFSDTVAIGAYPADIHDMEGCNYPEHVQENNEVLPFSIPVRALTNYQIDNLLVAGKSMAQTFMVNAATRLHPIEWSTGSASGSIGAWMVTNKTSRSKDMLTKLDEILPSIALYTPTKWTEVLGYPLSK